LIEVGARQIGVANKPVLACGDRADIVAHRVETYSTCNRLPACHDGLQAFLKRPEAEVDKSTDQDVVTGTTIDRVSSVTTLSTGQWAVPTSSP
jgi:hypothetical protein